MLITTANDLPGYTIDEVFGLTVRSRNAFSQVGAGLKSMFGGELKGMTKALSDSRQQVIDRMVEEAEARGGNAVVAMRFDTSEMARRGPRSVPTALPYGPPASSEPAGTLSRPAARGSDRGRPSRAVVAVAAAGVAGRR